MTDASNMTTEAASLLRSAGWTCIPPVDPNAAIPEPTVGQVWRSPKPRTEPRTIVLIGPHRMYPWAGDKCVFFTVPGVSREFVLNPKVWAAWVKKSGARPYQQ